MAFVIQGRFGPEQIVYLHQSRRNDKIAVGRFKIGGKWYRLQVNVAPDFKKDRGGDFNAIAIANITKSNDQPQGGGGDFGGLNRRSYGGGFGGGNGGGVVF
jgi:hypothetical protein